MRNNKSEKKPNRYLSHRKIIALSNFIRKTKHDLHDLSTEEVASRASRELGFPVAPTSVESIADVHDLKLKHCSARKSKSDSLIFAVVNLYERLGEPVPQDLSEFQTQILNRNNGRK